MKTQIRIPNDLEYAVMNRTFRFGLWRGIGPAWACLACGRSKRELMRWNGSMWTAILHTHHDHAALAWRHAGRFEHTVICDQCNAADGQAKRQLKLPKGFSFSPSEIRRFVTSTPHGSHRLDLDVALRVFKDVKDGAGCN